MAQSDNSDCYLLAFSPGPSVARAFSLCLWQILCLSVILTTHYYYYYYYCHCLSLSVSLFNVSLFLCVSFPLLCLTLLCLCFSILWPFLSLSVSLFSVYLLSHTQARQAQASAERCWLFLSLLTGRRSGQRQGLSYRIISSVSIMLKSTIRCCVRVGQRIFFSTVQASLLLNMCVLYIEKRKFLCRHYNSPT